MTRVSEKWEDSQKKTSVCKYQRINKWVKTTPSDVAMTRRECLRQWQQKVKKTSPAPWKHCNAFWIRISRRSEAEFELEYVRMWYYDFTPFYGTDTRLFQSRIKVDVKSNLFAWPFKRNLVEGLESRVNVKEVKYATAKHPIKENFWFISVTNHSQTSKQIVVCQKYFPVMAQTNRFLEKGVLEPARRMEPTSIDRWQQASHYKEMPFWRDLLIDLWWETGHPALVATSRAERTMALVTITSSTESCAYFHCMWWIMGGIAHLLKAKWATQRCDAAWMQHTGLVNEWEGGTISFSIPFPSTWHPSTWLSSQCRIRNRLDC